MTVSTKRTGKTAAWVARDGDSMASLDSEIVIKRELRPCYVDGRKALFHGWVDVADVITPSIAIGGHNGGTVRDTLALVEYENGKVAKVDTRYFRFADHGDFREIAWEDGKES